MSVMAWNDEERGESDVADWSGVELVAEVIRLRQQMRDLLWEVAR